MVRGSCKFLLLQLALSCGEMVSVLLIPPINRMSGVVSARGGRGA